MSINSLTEKIIIKGCLIDKNYVSTLSSTFEKEFFDDNSALRIYEYINNYCVEYKEIPSKDLIIGELDKNGSNEIRNFLTEVESFDYDWIKNYDHAFNITNEYLKGQSIKKAILNAVDIINKKGNIIEIRKHVEDALCKDLKIDLGTNYFGSIVDRIERMTSDDTIRVPTGYPTLDEYISGGFPPNSLSVIISKIHGGKSAFLANIAARQVLLGKNVVLVSLEMSEDAFSQRFDSIYSLLDINRMYRDAQLKTKLLKSLYNVAKKTNRGNLYIKQFPTGNATVNDYRKYFRELIIRGIKPDVFICDYINLMRPEYRNTGEMYMDVKTISEELRAFSFEFKIPVVSVSQLNREGMKVPFQEIDFTYIAESTGLIATCDFAAIFGTDEDNAVYENEIFYKLVKNRFGGRVGDINKFYIDLRNLKMYDVQEQNLWFDDIKISNDERKMVEVRPDPIERNRGRRTTTRR